ncbi:MAG: hypothetical protein CL570_05295 [Alphaproteobacteria bacterium]|nr:hypothetical protein [Alphaproteobacteria bacterium]|tara:strand:- start:24951 stop:27677 length:2727 start_codon:yes stop_codon:yes gene_type:complete
MAYNESGFGGVSQTTSQPSILQVQGDALDLPNDINLKNAHYARRGMDLLVKDAGHDVVVESYFAFDPAPTLNAGDAVLSPKLVSSFVKASPDYAANNVTSDESPVGIVDEITGGATVTRLDGSTETVRLGIEIYQGDIVETAGNGAVNIVFIDDTSFAVSEDARLAIDEYVYDPVTEAGQTDFSVLKGVFVYTSGAIGRDDPDDVTIDTPVGSIGIRGTIIAGDVDQGEITVVEGAIVLRDFGGNEVTLANQFETARFEAGGRGISHMGEMAAGDVVQKFASISNVAPDLFSSMNDAANENAQDSQEAADQADGTQDDASAQEVREDAGADTDQASAESTGEPKGEGAEQSANEDPQGDSKAESEGEGSEAKSDGEPRGEAEQSSGADGEAAKSDSGDSQSEANSNAEQGRSAGSNSAAPDNGGQSGSETSADSGQPKVSEPVKMADPNKMAGTSKQVPVNDAKPNPSNSSSSGGDNTSSSTPDGSATSNNTTSQSSEPVDPVAYEPDTNNRAPELLTRNLPPSEFFQVSENTGALEFFFDQVFRDLDGDAVTYGMSRESEELLNSLTEDQAGVGLLESDGAGAPGWSLDQANGRLILNINDAFEEYIQTLELTVVASDGIDSSFYTFEVKAFEDGATFTENGTSYTVRSLALGTSIDNDNEVVFVDDGDGGVTVNSSYSQVHLGEGRQDVEIDDAANGNLVIGGNVPESDNFFTVYDVDNYLYGMDGSDTFKVHMDVVDVDPDGATITDAVIDGGHNNLSTAQSVMRDLEDGVVDGDYSNLETGDMLEFYNAPSGASNGHVNFATLDVLVKNIETLYLEGDSVRVDLTVDDVLAMTDDHNVLMIQGDGNDVVSLAGFRQLDLNEDTDFDTSDLVNAGGNDYAVYTGTNENGAEVTLVVDSDIAITTV